MGEGVTPHSKMRCPYRPVGRLAGRGSDSALWLALLTLLICMFITWDCHNSIFCYSSSAIVYVFVSKSCPRRLHYLRRWFGLSGDGCGTICPEHPEIHGKEPYSGRTRHETDDLCHERPLISASLAETTALGVVSFFLLSLK